MVSWSDMSHDVLECVTRFLPFTDQERFSAVCQSWRYVAKQKRYPPAPQLPWLVLGEDEETKKRNFFNITEKRHYSIDIPELHGQYICGSSYGWLFTVDKRIDGELRLLNPFTRERFELPPYTRSLKQPRYILRKAVLSHDPKKRSDFTAMIVFGDYNNTLLMWRPGKKAWSVIHKSSICFMDIICFRGKFYAVSSSPDIYAVEVGSQPKMILTMSQHAIGYYLVDFKGKLLLVLRLARDYTKPREKFKVYEVDIKKGTYCEWNDLHSHAIFVGGNSTVVVSPRKIRCKKNGIYFGDCATYWWVDYEHDSGVYDMVSGTLRLYRSKKDPLLDPRKTALMWFTPNA